MREVKRVTGFNLALLIGYSAFFGLGARFGGGNGLEIGMIYGIIFFAHFIINIAASSTQFNAGNKALGRAHLLSAGVILLIGFSTCGSFDLRL